MASQPLRNSLCKVCVKLGKISTETYAMLEPTFLRRNQNILLLCSIQKKGKGGICVEDDRALGVHNHRSWDFGLLGCDVAGHSGRAV
jgi:hypothetical protein